MFTGLITDVGEIRRADSGHFDIACHYDAASIPVGASIACDGICLTATEVSPGDEGGAVFTIFASNETLGRTTAGSWSVGRKINLERSLRLGDELGGHIVTGHIDTVAAVCGRADDGASVRFEFESPAHYARFLAAKGSVALDGISLTVNSVQGNRFTINAIPHTLVATTLGEKALGDQLNMEVDLLARYVARLHEYGEENGAP